MTPDAIAELAHLRRARDHIDRAYAEPSDVPSMAEVALMSPSHFSRRFRDAYGETPYSYLMTREEGLRRPPRQLNAGSPRHGRAS